MASQVPNTSTGKLDLLKKVKTKGGLKVASSDQGSLRQNMVFMTRTTCDYYPSIIMQSYLNFSHCHYFDYNHEVNLRR